MHALKPACYLFPGVVFAKKIMCMAENINRLNFLRAFVFFRFVFHCLGVWSGSLLFHFLREVFGVDDVESIHAKCRRLR